MADDLKKSLEQLEESGKCLAKLTTYFEDAVKPLSILIKEVDKTLQDLMAAKANLEGLYNKQIA